MKDRVPTYPGRVKLTPVSGQANTYDMVRADSPTQEGTPLNKDTLLKDTTAASLGLTGDPTVDEAFAKLAKKSEYKVGDIKVTARTDLGDAWALCDGTGIPANASSELDQMIPAAEFPPNPPLTLISYYASPYDVFTAPDGKIYALLMPKDMHRTWVYQIAPTGEILRSLDTNTISAFYNASGNNAAYSVCVTNDKIYLYGNTPTSSDAVVVYGTFNGGDFPTSWTTVKIPNGKWGMSVGYQTTWSPGQMFFRVVNGKYYFTRCLYFSDYERANYVFSYSNTLGEAPTALLVWGSNYELYNFHIDAHGFIYIATTNDQSAAHVYKDAVEVAQLVFAGLTKLYFVENGQYTYVYTEASGPTSHQTKMCKLDRSNPTNVDATSSYSSEFGVPVLQWGDKIYSAYKNGSGSKYYLVTSLDNMLGAATSETIGELPTAAGGVDIMQGGAYISAGTNGGPLKIFLQKQLPLITFDGAYAYIKVKEETT
nr:MAG TPA: hypothetical protein [Caudoviricetes sp.]